jgi:hypothetical protein
METERTQVAWPLKVLTTPPVWVSQRLTVVSLLPDTRNVPSNENATDLTQSVCPERTDVQIPVIASRIMMSPDCKLTAMRSFQHARACGISSNETVREHDPHFAWSPLTTITSCESSEL